MVKRKKRLEKVVSSIEKEIAFHEEKKKIAEELGQEELVEYYTKEISALEKRRENRENKLNRK